MQKELLIVYNSVDLTYDTETVPNSFVINVVTKNVNIPPAPYFKRLQMFSSTAYFFGHKSRKSNTGANIFWLLLTIYLKPIVMVS